MQTDYFKILFLFLLIPVILNASFTGGGEVLFMTTGNLYINPLTSISDVIQIDLFKASFYGKYNIKNYTIFGKLYAEPDNWSTHLSIHIDRLYGAVGFGNTEITFGKQYFNTGYGRIFKINNMMGNVYSPLNLTELTGKTGISFMSYTGNNLFNIRGGTFINVSTPPYFNNIVVSRFSGNTYVLEEELNLDKYGIKLGQFYKFKNIDKKYLFSLSFNADLICGFNAEFQTFSNAMQIDSFSYRYSVSVDYTIPVGNGIYADLEYLYKKDSLLHVFSSDINSEFRDYGNKIFAIQVSYPFNLLLKSSVFGMYNASLKNYYTGGVLTIGKQIFNTDFVVTYKDYSALYNFQESYISVGFIFRLTL